MVYYHFSYHGQSASYVNKLTSFEHNQFYRSPTFNLSSNLFDLSRLLPLSRASLRNRSLSELLVYALDLHLDQHILNGDSLIEPDSDMILHDPLTQSANAVQPKGKFQLYFYFLSHFLFMKSPTFI